MCASSDFCQAPFDAGLFDISDLLPGTRIFSGQIHNDQLPAQSNVAGHVDQTGYLLERIFGESEQATTKVPSHKMVAMLQLALGSFCKNQVCIAATPDLLEMHNFLHTPQAGSDPPMLFMEA